MEASRLEKVEKSLYGTYWDEYVCMTLGQLAHVDGSKGHNRWGADPRHLTVVAWWANLNAISMDRFTELYVNAVCVSMMQ